MSKYIIMTLVMSVSFHCYSQYVFCDSISEGVEFSVFENQTFKSTSEYILHKYPDLERHVSNRTNLSSFQLWYNESGRMEFEQNGQTVSIKLEFFEIDTDRYFVSSYKENQLSPLLKDPDNLLYGLYPSDTVVNRITALAVNGIEMPENIFHDIVNINQFVTNAAVRPVAVYESICGNYIYIYVFGDIEKDKTGGMSPFYFSYMCKLIFKKNGGFIGRILETGNTLQYFGFDRCPLFVGF